MNFQKYFKPSASTSWQWNAFKTFVQTLIFWVIFLFIIPDFLMYIEGSLSLPTFNVQSTLGIYLFLIFSLLGFWSGATISILGQGTPLPTDCPNKLVVKGPYRFVRNPMAIAGISQGISVGLYFGSYIIILYALTGAVLWHYFVRPQEELDMENRFGTEYLAYRQNVKCWLPKF